MQNFTFYDGCQRIGIQSESIQQCNIIKLCSYKQEVFLLTTKHELFTGTIIEQQLTNVHLLRLSIVDVVCFKDILYVVHRDGCVYQKTLKTVDYETNDWNEIVVPNTKICPHGFKSAIEKVPIAQINCNEDGIIFISQSRELYAMGNFGDVARSEWPILVQCFNGFKILQVTTGDQFVVVLTHRKRLASAVTAVVDDKSEGSNDSAVFLSPECPNCTPNSLDNGLHRTDPSITSSDSQSVFEFDTIGSITTEFTGSVASVASSIKEFDLNTSNYDGVLLPEKCTDNVSTNGSASYHTRSISNNNHIPDDVNGEKNLSDHENRSIRSSLKEQTRIDDSFCEDLSTDITSALPGIGSAVESTNSIEKVYNLGASLLGTCVWCFGSVNKGLLGTGDHIKRTRINPVLGLTGQGVIKICSGREHSIALTLDGRLFLWGNNSKQQISLLPEIQDLSSPRRHQSAYNVLDAACGCYSTYILSNDLKIKEINGLLAKGDSKKKIFDTSKIGAITDAVPFDKSSLLHASGECYVQNHIRTIGKSSKYFTTEQKCLQDCLYTQYNVIKPLLKKIYLINQSKNHAFDHLCQEYQNILNLTAGVVYSLLVYVHGASNYLDILFIKCSAELITAFRTYVKCFCDVACIQGFQTINATLQKTLDYEIFLKPLLLITNHIEYIGYLLSECNENKVYLEAKRSEWERFQCEKNASIGLAQQTQLFWDNNGKVLIAKMQIPERRVILDSKEVQLKLLPSGRFSSHWFLLFNDVFCHFHGSVSSVYPLKTIWINPLVDNDIRKNAFKIITPEEFFVLVANTHETKMIWIEAIERNIKLCLEKPSVAKISQWRNACYAFSDKHHKYPGARYFGRWYAGQMHGIGHFEFADGRVYNGLFAYGAISGFGRMYTPGVGIYEGNFINDKYHGYGMLELKNKETYEGYFKDGKQHGHGILRTNSYTYIGEFKNDMKNGYGVLDNEQNGEKYLGMFVDNRRCGQGILIGMDGNYYEGNFVADALSGNGVAILTNGSYYEGELNAIGPAGRGSLFLSSMERKAEVIELDCRNIQMTGTIMSGISGGSWDDIKIYNGSLSMNQCFPKFPRTIGTLGADHSQKWCALFNDWKTDVFGSGPIDECKYVWSRIAVCITNSRRRQSVKSPGCSANSDEAGQSNVYSSERQESNTNGSLNKKIQDLLHEAEISDGPVANDFMNDNLKNGANLLEIFKSKQETSTEKNLNSTAFDYDEKQRRKSILDNLDYIPDFGVSKLDKQDLALVRDYLVKAFKDNNHPFGLLNSQISYCFYTSYGCWKVKPTSILSDQAMNEWDTITRRIYEIVRKLFPALPQEHCIIDGETMSHQSLMYPILLSEGIYSTLFVLYASKCCQNDELYRQRVMGCDKKTDEELVAFLKMNTDLLPLIKSVQFAETLACFKQLKEKYCPREMLNQIENTFKLLNEAKNDILGKFNVLNADNIMPLTIFLIIRAGIPHLGAEILLLEDLMGADFEPVMLGFAGYCFATIKATYQHILSDKFFQE